MRLRALVASAAVLASLLVPVPASAAWYDFTTDLPKVVAGPTPFTVNVGDAQVCRMTYVGQERTAAPWSFVYTPTDDRGWDSPQVEVQLCDGDTDQVWVAARTAFSVGPRLNSAEEGPVSLMVSNRTGQPGAVVIRDARGRKVAEAPLPAEEGTVEFRSRSKKPLVRYRAEVTAGPYSMSFPVDVMRGWSSYDRGYSGWGRRGGSLGNFEPCSTVKWSYSDASRPSGTSRSKVLADIKGALSRLSAVTGLTFVQERGDRAAGDQVLSIAWKDMGNPGPAGVGGTRGGSQDDAAAGFVDLNTRDTWATRDAEAGFGRLRNGPGGRGWLLVHELMHALGMSHTEERSQLMYPVNYGQTKLGKGDLAGLRYLYPRDGC